MTSSSLPSKPARGVRVAMVGLVASGALGLGACTAAPESESTPETRSSPRAEESGKGSPGKSDEVEQPLRVAFLGDSYVAGEGAKRPQVTRWTTRISERFGWKEINLGLGGTGYTTPGPEEKATTYVQRVDAVQDTRPDVVVVSGGRNDVLAEPERVRTTAVKLFRALQRIKGSPEVVVIAPLWDASPPTKRFLGVSRAVQKAARQVGVELVPVRRQPLAGRPEMISADKLHPTDRGHARIARALAPRLRKAVGEG